MQKFFGVSESSWKKKKEKLLANFSKYYIYEVEYKGRNINYHILKRLGEYAPEDKKSVKRDKAFEQGIIDIIYDDNIQTAANVSRRLINENYEIEKMNYTEGTVYEYTRVNMRNMFGTKVNEMGVKGRIMKKIWCRKDEEYNRYIPMNDEQIDKFFEIYSNEKEASKEYELEVFSDYQNGLITKEEMYEQIGERGYQCFVDARKTFHDKWGFWPIKVPVYEFNAWDNG